METQLFFPKDVIYLETSARIGFLEPYTISEVVQTSNGKFRYRIFIGPNPPANQTFGSSNDLRRGVTQILFGQVELVTFCDAIALVVRSLELKLTDARLQQNALCAPTGSG